MMSASAEKTASHQGMPWHHGSILWIVRDCICPHQRSWSETIDPFKFHQKLIRG
jgi:hypothetical protein